MFFKAMYNSSIIRFVSFENQIPTILLLTLVSLTHALKEKWLNLCIFQNIGNPLKTQFLCFKLLKDKLSYYMEDM